MTILTTHLGRRATGDGEAIDYARRRCDNARLGRNRATRRRTRADAYGAILEAGVKRRGKNQVAVREGSNPGPAGEAGKEVLMETWLEGGGLVGVLCTGGASSSWAERGEVG